VLQVKLNLSYLYSLGEKAKKKAVFYHGFEFYYSFSQIQMINFLGFWMISSGIFFIMICAGIIYIWLMHFAALFSGAFIEIVCL